MPNHIKAIGVTAAFCNLLVASSSSSIVTLPQPLVFYTFQEQTGSPRLPTPTSLYPHYALIDGNSSSPILQVNDGVFGEHSAYFPDTLDNSNNSQRLYAPRLSVPGITSAIAGPNATVTLISWIHQNATDAPYLKEGMVVGVWDEYLKARQYAIFTDLGACDSSAQYKGGLAAHISNCGGPTPGQRYCITRACDPDALPINEWHCLATVYDGTNIYAYVNGSLPQNGKDNPYYYPGGIYSPETEKTIGAEFAVGANMINQTATSPPAYSNRWKGRVGGVAVYKEALSQQQIVVACSLAKGF